MTASAQTHPSSWRSLAVVVITLLLVTAALGPLAGTATAATESEPNDSLGDAQSITVGTEVTGEVSASDDDDWFAFTATRGETIEISGAIEQQSGGFDGGNVVVELVDSNGDQIDKNRVRDGDTPESFTIGTTVVTGGTYYVHVEPEFGGFAADYNVTASTYRTDSFEPNENRSMAAPLFENPFVPSEARITLGDADWFAYGLAAGETVRLEATAGTPGADQELRIHDPGGNEANETVLNPGNTETVVWTATTSGVYNLVVAPQFGGTVDYNATMTVDGEPIGPANDRFERPNPPIGNQDRANATALDSGMHADLGMVDDDRDVFSVDLRAGERLGATIEFTHAENDLGLALTDDSGTRRNSSDTGTDDERLGFTAGSDGTYYLTVTGEAGANATYDLNLTVDSSGVTCTELSTFVQGYDGDGDCGISLIELGTASADFANGDITLTELGQVSTAFANT